MIRALHTTERESYNHNPFDFDAPLRFDAATVTKIKISPGTPRRLVEEEEVSPISSTRLGLGEGVKS